MMQQAFALLQRHQPTDLVAFGEGGERSRQALLCDVARVVVHLPAPTPGSHVALICSDRYLFAVALLAIWQRGHAAALPPNGQPHSVDAVADRPEVVALLHDTDSARGHDLRRWLATAPGEDAPELAAIEPGRLLATMWTSGSTGAPQPFRKTAAQLLGEAALWVGELGLPVTTPVLATVPPHHLYGLLFSVLAPLMGGWRFDRMTPLHAETVVARLAELQQAAVVSIPAHWRSLADHEVGALAPIAVGLSSTAPLHAAAAQALRDRHGLYPVEVFGSTETGGIASRQQCRADKWKPLRGVTVTQAADGTTQVRSPFAPGGTDDVYRGADLVTVHNDGTFDHLGRHDGVIKTGGTRVAVAEVEALLLAVPGVRDAAVIAVQSPQAARGTELWAAVVAPGQTVPELRESLLQRLDATVLPRRFVFVPRLPRTDTGKLPAGAVRALFGPATDLEVVDATAESDGIRLRLRVPQNLRWFDGHFRDHPVLPGIVQVHELVIRPVRAQRPQWAAVLRVQRLKFRRIIAPGDELTVAVRFGQPQGVVDFAIARGDDPCASGRLVFDAGGDRG